MQFQVLIFVHTCTCNVRVIITKNNVQLVICMLEVYEYSHFYFKIFEFRRYKEYYLLGAGYARAVKMSRCNRNVLLAVFGLVCLCAFLIPRIKIEYVVHQDCESPPSKDVDRNTSKLRSTIKLF